MRHLKDYKRQLARQHELTEPEVNDALNAVFWMVQRAMMQGNFPMIRLKGFGTFRPKRSLRVQRQMDRVFEMPEETTIQIDFVEFHSNSGS